MTSAKQSNNNGEKMYHLASCQKIATTFGVSRSTVVTWFKTGAPIVLIGARYQANYNELWTWLKKMSAQ